MENGIVYDCQRCGACCVDALAGEGYAWLDRAESKRMKRLGLHVVLVSGDSCLGTRAHGGGGGEWVCVAFQGEIAGSCGCAVYAHRPTVCRKFEVGSRN